MDGSYTLSERDSENFEKYRVVLDWCTFGLLGIWEPGHLGLWSSGPLGIWESGHLGIWASGHLGVWASGHLSVWASRQLGVWASWLLDVWASGHLGIGTFVGQKHWKIELDGKPVGRGKPSPLRGGIFWGFSKKSISKRTACDKHFIRNLFMILFSFAPKEFMTLICEFMPLSQFLKYLNRHEFVNHGHRKKTVRQNDKHVHKDDDKS